MDVNKLRGGILGVAIGDALGVPVEFTDRSYLKRNPVTKMIGYGSWNQPPGTWSDDSSLMLCLLEGLTYDYDIERIGKLFASWYKEGHWGAHHKVFDIGGGTRSALNRIIKGESATVSGNFSEESNGNGSLMRTLPLVYFLEDEVDLDAFYRVVKEVSSVTHAHFRSCFACFIYCVFAKYLLQGYEKFDAYKKMQITINEFVKIYEFNKNEVYLFKRVLQEDISNCKEETIGSSGYVLDSLEASLWCLLTTNSYKEAVLKAVNLGRDTDTTGAITGGIAGILYGIKAIPEEWRLSIARINEIEMLIDIFNKKHKK